MQTQITKDQILAKLKNVLDPELNINIVDLGLVYEVMLNEVDKPPIQIKMTLTTPGCPMGSTIIRMIRDEMAALPKINPEQDVTVEIVFDPPWTQDMLSQEAKAELGY